MIDSEGKKRREIIFEKYRRLTDEYNIILDKRQLLREEIDAKNAELQNLKSLIEIMIEDDCCPVEAQLKYIDQNKNQSKLVLYYDDSSGSSEYNMSLKKRFKIALSNKLHKIALKLTKTI